MSILNLEIKKLPQSQVEISCEISADEFESAYKEAFKKFNEKTNLPGFRPGHIPEKNLIEKIGEQIIIEEAVHITINKTYPRILKENNIDAVGYPQASVTKLARNNPLGLKIITAIMPEIKLPDYKAIAKETMSKKEDIVVEDKDVDEALEYLRKSKEKKEVLKKEGQIEQADEGQAQTSPEVNDEFAKSFGNFNSLGDLKSALRDNIKLDKEFKAREKKRMEALKEICKKTEMIVPDIFIVSEKEKMLAELRSSIENMGMAWDKYLEHIKKSEDELKKGWDKDAEDRVNYGLILRHMADEEKIEPSIKEVDDHVSKMLLSYPPADAGKIDRKKLKDYAYGILRNEKVFQLLEGQSADDANKKQSG